MEKLLAIALIVAPILFAAGLGVLARRKAMITADEIRGLQQFVIKFGLPCLLFNSCLTAEISPESVSTMVMVAPLSLAAALWAFHIGKKRHPYHNLPLLFCGKETGMLGIPLFIVLFGAAQSYHMGVLDLAQAVVAIPVVSILSTDSKENPSAARIAKEVVTSPLLVFSILGLILNLTGIRGILDRAGITEIITGSTAFLGQPVSAMMLFCAGYSFSLSKKDQKTIWIIAAKHFAMHGLFCVIAQLLLCLIPNVNPISRWTMLMYYTLPASYIAPSVGHTEDDYAIASSVCSLLTVSCLIVFCYIAFMVV